jgi:hypothetical protein
MNLYSKSTRDLVQSLTETAGLNQEDFAAIKSSEVERERLVESSLQSFQELYGADYEALGSVGKQLLKEDIDVARTIIANNMSGEGNPLNETTSISMLTASIATTIRKPMEANMHRVFDVEAVSTPIVTLEQYFDTLTNPANQKVDAYTAFNTTTFLDSVVEPLVIGTEGIAPTRARVNLLAGQDSSVHRIDTDARITGLVYFDAGVEVVSSKIRYKRGTVPYFDSKTGTCDVTFLVAVTALDIREIKVDARIDFATGELVYLNVDQPKSGAPGSEVGVEKVKFDIHLGFDAHTSAIALGARNSFISLPIPTSPHFEVSESIEKLHDIKSGESHLKGRDFVSMLTEKMTVYSAAKEDLSLFSLLSQENNHLYDLSYDYEAPSTYAAGSPFEWIKLNLVNLIDTACTQMKHDYHIKSAVFKIAISPIMLRIIDNGYNFNTDESVTSALNYSVVAKTAANTMIFISSERYDDIGQINMILPDKDTPIIKTFCYYKYQSFLTDALQSSRNTARKAIVFAERNLPTVLEPVACKLTIENMPHKKTDGNRIVKVLG